MLRIKQTWWQLTHLPRSEWKEVLLVFVSCVAHDAYVRFQALAQAERKRKDEIAKRGGL